MTKAQLQKKIDRLEFIQDQLQAELSYVDFLLKEVGFPNGLVSAKEVALEIIAKDQQKKE